MIVAYPDERLRAPNMRAIPASDLVELFDMLNTVRVKYNGIGIAAPQIGINMRLCICVINGQQVRMVNPRITAAFGEANDLEGCLSFPDHDDVLVPRATLITVRWETEKGKHRSQMLNGYAARVVQHEVDHLNGVLIVDRALESVVTP